MWMCPTFQRPDRLKELAEAWKRTAAGEPLYVRIWTEDKYKDEYFAHTWPEEWVLYESDAEWCGEAIQEFFTLYPGADSYGFIGDDVVPCTDGWVKELESAAGAWFVAYPNDTIQRHGLCTHAVIGGELLRTLGWWVPPGFKHHYLDQVWMNVGGNCGLLRYCPQVTFYHKHPVVKRVKTDAVYAKADAIFMEGAERWDDYTKNELKRDVTKVRKALSEHFEFKDLKGLQKCHSI